MARGQSVEFHGIGEVVLSACTNAFPVCHNNICVAVRACAHMTEDAEHSLASYWALLKHNKAFRIIWIGEVSSHPQ